VQREDDYDDGNEYAEYSKSLPVVGHDEEDAKDEKRQQWDNDFLYGFDDDILKVVENLF
jgi:hypothetical protein